MARIATIEAEHGELYFITVDHEDDLAARLSRAEKYGFMRVYNQNETRVWINVDRINKIWIDEPY